jgi:uncharacterized protein YhfF
MKPIDLDAAAAFWTLSGRTGDYTVERFGDHAALADSLLDLVLSGRKRATSSLVGDLGAEPLPRIGVHWIVCDSTGAPRAILRTTELRLGSFLSVTESFAFDEGEDDRSRESWMTEHRRFWKRAVDDWSGEEEVLFERFRVVYPPESADHAELA